MSTDKTEGISADAVHAAATPVLAVVLGRGGAGKSTGLEEIYWRARDQGREVIIADGDARSATLRNRFPYVTSPSSEELPDIKEWLDGEFNRMARERKSVVLDLGGGDRVLQEYGRSLRLVEFCRRRGVEPVAIYFLGPDAEDLRHVVSLWDAEHFRPKRALLVLNEGVIRQGKTTKGAFEPTMNDPDLLRMVEGGAVPVLMRRLDCMDAARAYEGGFYAAAARMDDWVKAFQIEEWLAHLRSERAKHSVETWLP